MDVLSSVCVSQDELCVGGLRSRSKKYNQKLATHHHAVPSLSTYPQAYSLRGGSGGRSWGRYNHSRARSGLTDAGMSQTLVFLPALAVF